MLWSHVHTSSSSLPSPRTLSSEGISPPEAVRNHVAIGPTPLCTIGGVVPTEQAHCGHV